MSRSLLARPRPDPSALPVGQDPVQQRAASLVRGEPVVCEPDTPVREAAKRMAGAEASAALVRLEQNGAFGIVTDSDLRKRVLAPGREPDVPVAEVMSAPAFSVGPDELGTEVMLHMLDRGVRHIPVVSAFGEPLGILVAVGLLFGPGQHAVRPSPRHRRGARLDRREPQTVGSLARPSS